jgi:hypothetical protein
MLTTKLWAELRKVGVSAEVRATSTSLGFKAWLKLLINIFSLMEVKSSQRLLPLKGYDKRIREEGWFIRNFNKRYYQVESIQRSRKSQQPWIGYLMSISCVMMHLQVVRVIQNSTSIQWLHRLLIIVEWLVVLWILKNTFNKVSLLF